MALVPVFGPAGRLEFGDDPAAVAIEHALLGERAVGAVAVDVGAPAFLLAVVDDRLAARDRGSAAARRFRPLSAVAVPRRHARLVRVVSVVRAVAVLRLRARCFKVRHGRCPPKMTAPARQTCGPAAGAVIDSVCWWEPRRRYRGTTPARPRFRRGATEVQLSVKICGSE